MPLYEAFDSIPVTWSIVKYSIKPVWRRICVECAILRFDGSLHEYITQSLLVSKHYYDVVYLDIKYGWMYQIPMGRANKQTDEGCLSKTKIFQRNVQTIK